MRFFVCIVFILSVFSAQAIVLDWNGFYTLEANTIQKADFENWGSSKVFHNLHLKPDIKAFDKVRVRSWFQLNTRSNTLSSISDRKFTSQEGVHFNWDNDQPFSLPIVTIRDLYMEVAHDFGLLQVGWKPHHFGLGMYYNDSSTIFDSFYNLEGSRGFISWRGFIGSSYYIQPMIHYANETLFNLFIQAGFSKDKYGVEVMYKTSPQGIEGENSTVNSPSYLGIYGYYKANTLTAHLELGRTSEEVYGGVLNIDWKTPVKWLKLNLEMGAATAEEKNAFHFDPSFSSNLSFLIEEYEENLKPKIKKTTTELSPYSFHSAFYLAPSVFFSLSDSLSLKSIFSMHISYSEMDALLYHKELTLKYKLDEGLTWNTGIGVLFPSEDHWHIGLISQAAITF